MTSPPRIPKGSKEGGQFMPKWAQDVLQETWGNSALVQKQEQDIDDLRSRLGTSTPLIIWNIAVLIVLCLLIAKVYDVGHLISGSAL